jgi:hypothetical protein
MRVLKTLKRKMSSGGGPCRRRGEWLRSPLCSDAGLKGLDVGRAFCWFHSERRVL